MKDEAEKARQHELQLVELMLKHQSPPNNQVTPSPPCHPPCWTSDICSGCSTTAMDWSSSVF